MWFSNYVIRLKCGANNLKKTLKRSARANPVSWKEPVPNSLKYESFHECLQRLLQYIFLTFTFTTKILIHTLGSKYNVCLYWAKTKSGHRYSVNLLKWVEKKRGSGPFGPPPKSTLFPVALSCKAITFGSSFSYASILVCSN